MSGHTYGRGCRAGGPCGCDSYDPRDETPFTPPARDHRSVEQVNRELRELLSQIGQRP
jgi:hypothetical protein